MTYLLFINDFKQSIVKFESASLTLRQQSQTSHAHMMTHTHTKTLSCFTSVFHPLPCPDSWCPPWGPLKLPSPLITVAWPPTLHSVRDYPPLPLALPFTLLLSLCLSFCCFLSLLCSLFHTSPSLHTFIDLGKKTTVDSSVHLRFWVIKRVILC